MTTSRVHGNGTADALEAAGYFAARLRCETDASDVWHDLDNLIGNVVVLDPRGRDAHAAERVPGAISLPHAEIDGHSTAELDRDAVYVVYGWYPGCNAGTKAALKLSQLGFTVKEIIGGIEYWKKEGLPVEASATGL
ncbi:rhodanese-like domain-containing protein [Longispora sp. K20-0274]|uniref:rhodanese-like domain-containing protein n=1 Tax=Longispora sp. K20-0274 TaxID=3088255 RepID=UPI00399A7746